MAAGRGPMAFSPTAGGFVDDAEDRWRVRPGTHAALQAVLAGVGIDAIDEPSVERANRLLCAYGRAILERDLATMRAVLRGRGVG